MDQKNSEYEHFLCSVFDGENFEISVYNLSRADESSENKCWWMYMHHKNSLPFKVTNFNYLEECNYFELKVGKKFIN